MSILAITILSLIEMIKKELKSTDLCNTLFKSKFVDNICQFLFKEQFIIIHLIFNISLILLILVFLIPEFLLLILHINVLCTNYKEEKNNKATESFSTNSILNEDDNSLLPSDNASTL